MTYKRTDLTAQRALESAQAALAALDRIPSRMLMAMEKDARDAVNASREELVLLTEQLRTVRDWSQLQTGGNRACANQSSTSPCFAYNPITDENAAALLKAHGREVDQHNIPRSRR